MAYTRSGTEESRQWQDRFRMDENFEWVLKDGETAELFQPALTDTSSTSPRR